MLSTDSMHLLDRRRPLTEWKSSLRDGRANPEVSAGTIGQLVAEMVPRRQTSILEVDQDARHKETIFHFGAEDRRYDMVASDSTIFRSLSKFDLPPIHSILWENARRFLREPPSSVSLPSGQTARVGFLDGSVWGRIHGSVLTIAGSRADQVAGYQKSPGRGHELATSATLERKAQKKLGDGFVDYLGKDALYVTEDDFQRARQGGYHLVAKTEDETLNLINEARPRFYWRYACPPQDLMTVEGTDPERGCTYTITAGSGFTWQGVDVKVAHVKETYDSPKPGHPEQTEFWVITTDRSMNPHDMREIKIMRWRIENRTFRRLSQLVDGKRRITEDPHVREALLGLWFIGLNLMGLAIEWMKPSRMRSAYRTMKTTWKFFCKRFLRELQKAYLTAHG